MNNINIPFNLPETKIISVATDKQGNILIKVETIEDHVQCHICQKKITKKHGSDRELKIRHLPAFGNATFIVYSPNRYVCEECHNHPTTTATPSWHKANSSYSIAYEKHVMMELINSTIADVSKKESLTEESVMGILNRWIEAEVNWKQLATLGIIGLDEISLKKGYKDYVTLVTSRKNGTMTLLAILEGRKKSTIQGFLKKIPKRLVRTIDAVCVDLYDGYINAVRSVLKKKTLIVIDRYHVAKLYRGELDRFRQKIIKELKQLLSPQEYEQIIGATRILRKNHECLSKKEKEIVKNLFSYSPELMEAYSISIKLTQIFNTHLSKEAGLKKLEEWIEMVKESELICFSKFIKTLKKWINEISNYFIDRNTSAFVEGFNNKVKVLKRRCYGIYDLKHFFQRLFLDVSGYELFLKKPA